MSIAVATIKDVDEDGPIIEWHQHWSELKGRTLYAHLTQPAQAVDVGALRGELYGIAADNHKSALTLGEAGLRGQCIETSKRLHDITRALPASPTPDKETQR